MGKKTFIGSLPNLGMDIESKFWSILKMGCGVLVIFSPGFIFRWEGLDAALPKITNFPCPKSTKGAGFGWLRGEVMSVE